MSRKGKMRNRKGKRKKEKEKLIGMGITNSYLRQFDFIYVYFENC